MTSHSVPPPPALRLDRITGAIFDLDSVVTATASATARAWTRLFDVAAYPATVQLIRELRRSRVRTAIVSAGRRCEEMLAAAAITHLFDALIDGDGPGSRGRPGPAAFLTAAEHIGVVPSHCVIVEDGRALVIPGLEAFGMVIGIDRTGDREVHLSSHGTEAVVRSLAEVRLTGRPLEQVGTRDEWP